MKTYYSALLAGITAATFSINTAAQSAVAAPEGKSGSQLMDCSKWKDKARCESLKKDVEACRDKTDDDWRECMHRAAPAAKFTPPKPRDCTKAKNVERCEAHNTALESCKQMATRAEHRKCMSGQAPAPGKS